MAAKADIVARWYRTVWTEGRFDEVDHLYVPANPDACLLPSGSTDPNEIKELIGILRTLVSDLSVQVVHCIEDGDWVSALLELNAVKADTADPVHASWQVSMRIQGDIIVETYPSFNFISFFEQLGQLPDDAYWLLLGGTVLR